MAAVICRVVAFPTARTEYLQSQPNEPESWTDKDVDAFVFPTHRLADQVADSLRKLNQSRAVTNDNGFRKYWFIHARTIEDHERARFASTPPHVGGKSKAARRRQLEEQMRAEDVRQLEEAYR